MLACALIGVVLNLLGTGLAGWALLDDWNEHGREPLWPWLARTWRWVAVNVFRKRTPPPNRGFLVGDMPRVTSEVSVSWTLASDAPLEEQVRHLHRAVERLNARVDAERKATAEKIMDVRAELATTAAEAREATSAVEELARHIATGSVRRELTGLLLIGVGSVISVLPAILGWS